MNINKLRELIKCYDDGDCTEHEVEHYIDAELLQEKIDALKNPHGMFMSFTAGAFRGPLPHSYGMFDVNAQSKTWYQFTLANVVRFYWNKLMRRLGRHRWTWIW